MPRQARKKSRSGIYHIILRGIDRNLLFLCEQDFEKYLQTLKRFNADGQYEILAYCLMDNHIHLLMNFHDDLPGQYIQKVSVSYAGYFNKKYERTGHLFQNRFRSEAVEEEAYLLSAMRYIHRNPEKAGICAASQYRWSSYSEYAGENRIIDKKLLMGILGGVPAFLDYMDMEDDCKNDFLEFEKRQLTDSEALRIVQELSGSDESRNLQALKKEKRNCIISKILARGVSARQLARLTGLNRKTINRVGKDGNDNSA